MNCPPRRNKMDVTERWPSKKGSTVHVCLENTILSAAAG